MRHNDHPVAIITGAAVGIGRAIAERLGRDGARICLFDCDDAAVEETSQRLAAAGVEVATAVGDVAEPRDVQACIDITLQTWKRVDILVNNAGTGGISAPIEEQSVEELDRVYRTNLRGVFLFCQAVVPVMRKHGFGRIVNLASMAGKDGNARMIPYSATKAGVIGLTKALGKELAETGVTVNAVTPAIIRTGLLDQLGEEQVQSLIDRIPMRRTGTVDEVADLVAFIASRECSFTTAAVFDISGGRATY